MDELREAEKLLSAMTRAEKARLLQRVAGDLAGDGFPGVESTPGVCGGEPRIVRTRYPLCGCWSRRDAWASARRTCCEATPRSGPKTLFHVWAYARAHGDELDRQIRENEEA